MRRRICSVQLPPRVGDALGRTRFPLYSQASSRRKAGRASPQISLQYDHVSIRIQSSYVPRAYPVWSPALTAVRTVVVCSIAAIDTYINRTSRLRTQYENNSRKWKVFLVLRLHNDRFGIDTWYVLISKRSLYFWTDWYVLKYEYSTNSGHFF